MQLNFECLVLTRTYLYFKYYWLDISTNTISYLHNTYIYAEVSLSIGCASVF